MIGKAGLAKESDFLPAVVGKQARDSRILFDQWTDQIGMQDRIDLSVRQHLLDRALGRQAHDLQVRGRLEFDGFVQFANPFDRLQRHAVFMLEDAAQPDDRRVLELLDADLAAHQIGRRPDALRRVDEDEAMAEPAVQEDGNGVDGNALIARDQV
jgi:hypothetical protein